MEEAVRYVGRLAPSPTGALHLGNVRTFMIAYLRARQAGGKLIMRMEDLDHPKHKAGAATQAIEDLKWLGFDWDEEYVQSERVDRYRAALEKLKRMGKVYPCICSRADVEHAQSAPHEGEQLKYTGTCRGRFASWEEAYRAKGAPPCWRFRTDGDDAQVAFEDGFVGRREMNVGDRLGDFPLARDENGAGYSLAVVVDDAEMGVTEVVRGDDLVMATFPQILVYRALGYDVPRFFHVPLVVGEDGRRLAKRHGDTRISAFREAGVRAEELIGCLAYETGLLEKKEPTSLKELIGSFEPARIRRAPLVYKGFSRLRASS